MLGAAAGGGVELLSVAEAMLVDCGWRAGEKRRRRGSGSLRAAGGFAVVVVVVVVSSGGEVRRLGGRPRALGKKREFGLLNC